jgi:hypothetical protein
MRIYFILCIAVFSHTGFKSPVMRSCDFGSIYTNPAQLLAFYTKTGMTLKESNMNNRRFYLRLFIFNPIRGLQYLPFARKI